MADIKYPKKRGEIIVLSVGLCELWQKSNKLRNPTTNRPLKSTSKTIKKIEKQCKVILKSTVYSDFKTDPRIKNIGKYQFIAERTYGEGSCFFHSVARLIDPKYQNKRSEGLELRNNIAQKLTFEDYLDLSNGMLAKITLITQYNLDIDPYAFDTLSIEQIIRQRPDYKTLQKQLQKNYKHFVAKFMNKNAYANEDMVDFTSKILGVNIVIMGSESGKLTSARPISKLLPTIFLYNLGQYHYEPLVRKDDKRMVSWSRASKMLKGESFLNI